MGLRDCVKNFDRFSQTLIGIRVSKKKSGVLGLIFIKFLKYILQIVLCTF